MATNICETKGFNKIVIRTTDIGLVNVVGALTL